MTLKIVHLKKIVANDLSIDENLSIPEVISRAGSALEMAASLDQLDSVLDKLLVLLMNLGRVGA
jgi:hypothetical protein